MKATLKKGPGPIEKQKLHIALSAHETLTQISFPKLEVFYNNYYFKRLYFCINFKGYIFFFPSRLCGLTYPEYLHKSPVTVNMYSTIQSSITYQVRVKTEGEMSA